MGQSLTVALKSVRMEIKRMQRRRAAHARQNEEHVSILQSPVVAFEEGNHLPDPPFL